MTFVKTLRSTKSAIRKQQLENDLKQRILYAELHEAEYKDKQDKDGPVEYAVLKDNLNE